GSYKVPSRASCHGKSSRSLCWLQGPAITDIKQAQVRDRFNLKALRGSAVTDIKRARAWVVWRIARPTRIGVGQQIMSPGRVLSVDQHYLGSWHVGCVRVWEAQPMNVLILDEQLELADHIRQLARRHGWQPHFVGSLPELELALATQ